VHLRFVFVSNDRLPSGHRQHLQSTELKGDELFRTSERSRHPGQCIVGRPFHSAIFYLASLRQSLCHCSIQFFPDDATGGGEVVSILTAWGLGSIEDPPDELQVQAGIVVDVADGPSLRSTLALSII